MRPRDPTALFFLPSEDEWYKAATDVGSYSDSASPYGTFDQGGNVWEWNETAIGSERGIRGRLAGDLVTGGSAASSRGNALPGLEDDISGFRVAGPIPEPGTALLLAADLVGLAV